MGEIAREAGVVDAVEVACTFSGVVAVGVVPGVPGKSGPDRRRYELGVWGFRRKG